MFGSLSPRRFLERYWQKEPLLLRGAVPNLGRTVTREELFDLARTARSDSRLIRSPREGMGWELRRGPFDGDVFDRLPPRGWTLLIQEADRHLPTCAALLDRFRFTPNWRIDDVMVSYAVDGGGVGPHVDRYDVFLIQASGRRRWRIAPTPLADPELVPGIDLPVLAEFSPSTEWILEPGDLLYLPPRVPHEGVAVGSCVTYSVGFRVPDPRELCAGFLTQLGPQAFEAIRYEDPDLQVPEHLGEVSLAARRRLRESARRLFEDGAFDEWTGRYLTRPLRREPVSPGRVDSPDELRRRLEHGTVLVRSAPAHFAWYRDDEGIVQLFVGGENYPLGSDGAAAAELLCGRRRLDRTALIHHLERESFVAVLVDSILRGLLTPEPNEPD